MEDKNLNLTDVKSSLKSILDDELLEEALKNNFVEIVYNNDTYKINKLTAQQRKELYEKRIEKHTELLQAKDVAGKFIYKRESELRAIYKERGIDIDVIEENMTKLEFKRKDIMKKLGEVLTIDKDQQVALTEEDIKGYRTEIESLSDEFQNLSFQKTQLLEFSLETQVNIFVYTFAVCLATEKKVEDKWVKAFASYEDYMNAEEALLNKLAYYGGLIISSALTSK